MTGLLGNIGAALGGLLGSPRAKDALLLSIASGGDPRFAAGLMGQRNEMQRANKQDELYQLKMEEARRKADETRLAQQRQQQSQSALSSLSLLAPEYQAMYRNDPAFQQAFRANQVAYGDPAAAEQSGLLAPLPSPQEEPATIRTIRAMGGDPTDPKWQQVILHSLLRPKSQVTVNNSSIKPPPGHYFPIPGDYTTVAPMKGGPADPSASKEGREQASNIARVDQALNNYRQAVTTVGTKVIPGPEKLRLSSAHTDLLMEMKELYNLGVLNGPDYELMLSVIRDPTSVWTVGQGYTGDDLLKQLDSVVVPKLDAAKKLYREKYGRNFNEGVGTAPNGTPNKSLSDYSDAELEAELRRLESGQ